MRRFIFPFLASCFVFACSDSQSFQTDTFCASCIEKACADTHIDAEFQSHFQSLSDEDKAQMTALVEAVDDCFEHQPWTREIADNAYKTYGNALYAISRPMHQSIVLRAFDEIIQKTDNKSAAASYLSWHASEFKDKSWAKDKINALSELVEEDDDIFALDVKLADSAQIEKLAQMESTANRDKALLYRWNDLPEEMKTRALGSWVSAQWVMQTSGSAQLPQYLSLDWMKRPFPDGVPQFIATIQVESIKIQNNEVKRKDWMAKDVFKWPPMRESNAYHARVDLSPWLNSADNYKITADAKLEVWAENTPDNCLNHEEDCGVEPIYSTPVSFNKSYRVFVGVETGAPHRVKQDKENLFTSNAFTLDICSAENCVALWKDGAKTKDRSTRLDILQGNDFYVKANVAGADLPVASRLMARSGDGKAWREIATFFSFAPIAYDLPMRANVDLGDLCDHLGACKLELQLRPSLRMARHDPRIAKYWGATLELGNISLEMLNQTPQQLTN